MGQQDVIDILSINLIGIIPEDPEIVVSTNRGVPLAYNHASFAGQAYNRVAQRLEGVNVPIPQFKPENWFGQIMSKLLGQS